MMEWPLLSVLTDSESEGCLSLENYCNMIRADLESLFSVRLLSVAHQDRYGLHSMAGLDLGTATGRLEFCQHAQIQIERFEPRLKNLRVSFAHKLSVHDRVLRLKILANLSIVKAVFESSVILSAKYICVEELL